MNVMGGLLAARFDSSEVALERLGRFLAALVDGRIDSNDLVAVCALLLGACCGMLGSFVVLRRQSMLGDAIGHAVLPGVCLGFVFAGERSTPWLLAGAAVAGVVASVLIQLLQRTTPLKSGETMGVVFTGFYGIGIVLLSGIQRSGAAGQAGLEKFLFGQIVGVTGVDVAALAVVGALVLGVLVVGWPLMKVSTFDEVFARSIGMPARGAQVVLLAMLTAVIVVSIQAVGVVLVSAMLVTPAAAAYLLTDRLGRMTVIAAVIGAVCGLVGAGVSVMGDELPTGALMVLTVSAVFAAAFLLSPNHGVLPRVMRRVVRQRRTQAENLLRSLYLMDEKRDGDDRRFGISDIAAVRQESAAVVRATARVARRYGWLAADSLDPIILTDAGSMEAKRLVRSHRLWELFLSQQANLKADHVHANAEEIEHVLPPEILKKLEAMLDHPTTDPHGRAIPRTV
jgi:manganese/zinc/iron transport system permease protein